MKITSTMLYVADARLNQVTRIEDLLLDEDAPDESRPSRQFHNISVLAAFELGKRKGKLIQKRRAK